MDAGNCIGSEALEEGRDFDPLELEELITLVEDRTQTEPATNPNLWARFRWRRLLALVGIP